MSSDASAAGAPLFPSGDGQGTQRLRAAGLRVTGVRLAVLAAVERRPHVRTDEVIAQVRSELGSVSTQAVYNVLASLVAAGLLRRIEPAGSAPLFEARVGDNHHHVVCRSCGATADVDCVVGARPCLSPSDAGGFDLDEAEITFWGLCPSCQQGGRAAARGEVANHLTTTTTTMSTKGVLI